MIIIIIIKIMWDVMIHCDSEIKARKQDIFVVNKNEKSCTKIDIAVPGDIRKRKIKRMWNMRSIKVIPVVVWTLGSISKKLKNYREELVVVVSTALLQKTTLSRTACILRF